MVLFSSGLQSHSSISINGNSIKATKKVKGAMPASIGDMHSELLSHVKEVCRTFPLSSGGLGESVA